MQNDALSKRMKTIHLTISRRCLTTSATSVYAVAFYLCLSYMNMCVRAALKQIPQNNAIHNDLEFLFVFCRCRNTCCSCRHHCCCCLCYHLFPLFNPSSHIPVFLCAIGLLRARYLLIASASNKPTQCHVLNEYIYLYTYLYIFSIVCLCLCVNLHKIVCIDCLPEKHFHDRNLLFEHHSNTIEMNLKQ